MARIQLALRVADLEGSIAFYTKLFGTQPAKRQPGYANFAIAEPPLKLVLMEGGEGGEVGIDTQLDHLGIEVETTEQVTAAADRLRKTGLAISEQQETSCCYALQDKAWTAAPGGEPWEVYTVKADTETMGTCPCCG